MGYNELSVLMENLANLIIPLFAHRFARIGSIYLGPDPNPVSDETSTMPTPTANHHVSNPLSLSMTPVVGRFAKSERFPFPTAPPPPPTSEFHVGPIISWPFFGSNRGEMTHPDEINRGPWPSTYSYLLSCVQREIDGVIRENEGKSAPHRLHLDPDEILSSRHHQLQAVPGDESDNSDEWDMQESEEEWEGPGDSMYRDYRRMQRSTFLVAHLKERENRVQSEMSRVVRMMERLGVMRREDGADTGGGGGTHEEFTLDCHDLSLENVFVDENDNTKIVRVVVFATALLHAVFTDYSFSLLFFFGFLSSSLALSTGSLLRHDHSGLAHTHQRSSSQAPSQQNSSAPSLKKWQPTKRGRSSSMVNHGS